MDHSHDNMSATYVPSKRKTSRPKLKAKTPAVPKILDEECEAGGIGSSKNVEASSQKTQKIKRTYGRKRYHDLQTVPMSPAEDSASESSCCSVVSSHLANGAEDPVLPSGTTGTACRTEGADPVLPSGTAGTACRTEGADPVLPSGTAGTACRTEGADGEPSSQTVRGADFAMKKRRRMEVVCCPVKHHSEEVQQSVSVPVVEHIESSHVSEQAVEEQRAKALARKKDLPCYPSGSQDERWHLQILAKGRVTCPRCKTVGRKTVDGLKKHMATCKLNPFTCQHCGKQLKSSTGMKYHLMADHNNLPSSEDGNGLDDQSVKEKLRKVLKRMGKLKCSKEGCTGSFTSIMGYLYHMKKCGKGESELEKLLLNCRHCGKAYRSRAGLEYHLKSEHGPTPLKAEDEEVKTQREPNPERTPSGRVKRMSAQVAVFHLQEIASEELLKEWPKRKVQRDLVPDDKKLKYARPGLPAFSQDVLRKWKNEVKLQRKVQCPNQGCDSVYTSVSGLKAHLGLCTRGEFEAGKYKCLICDKEFNSESGVKYHINSVHSQDWFVVTSKASKNFEKLLKTKPKEDRVERSDLPEPSPALRLPPGAQAQTRPPSGGKTRPGTADGKRKEEKERVKEKSRKQKDCYDFSGSDSPSSSSSSSSSSSESEAEDTWALKRPLAQPDTAKRPRSNP